LRVKALAVGRHPCIAPNHGAILHVIFAQKKRLVFKGLGFEQNSVIFALGLDCAVFEPYAPPYVRALVVTIPVGRFHMSETTREKLLKIALVVFGAIFLLVYPLGLIWPSGWVWHGGEGKYYFQMICGIYAVLGVYLIAAARNPSEHQFPGHVESAG
jgi:hypothetical protein